MSSSIRAGFNAKTICAEGEPDSVLTAISAGHALNRNALSFSETCEREDARRAQWCVLVLSSRKGDGEEIAAMLGPDYEVHQATLLEGIESAVQRVSPDLVLLDWETGAVGGEPACAELAGHPGMKDSRLLVLGAPPDPMRKAAVLEAGASGFIEKPFCPELVRQMAGSEVRIVERLRVSKRRRCDAKDAHVGMVLTASEVISMKSQFEEIFKRVRSIPWMHATGEGAVLLCDEAGELTPVLAQGNLPNVEQCARVSGATCLCKQVAGVRRPTYVADSSRFSCFRGREEARGIHILPLMRDGKPLGVMLLCVPAGHEPGADEMEFAGELAITAGALASRRLMEAVLEIKNYEVHEAHSEVIRLLGLAGEYRDIETGMHVFRVGQYARSIARAAGVGAEEAEILFEAAPMHDIGKVGIPDSLLRKRGSLTPEEIVAMQEHTMIGEQILQGRARVIEAARIIAGSHHERWDGKGYPRGLKGEQIPLFGRICAVADVFDALGQPRPYKRAWGEDEIERYIRKNAGAQFDPKLVKSFFSILPEILRLQTLYGDSTTLLREPVHLTPFPPVQTGILKWSDAFSVRVPIIDEHHRYLLDLTNAVWDALHGSGKAADLARTLKALENYTKLHFSEEERLMARYHYVHLEEHARLHRQFVASLERSWESLRKNPIVSGMKTFSFLSGWLVKHVQGADATAFRTILPEIARDTEMGYCESWEG